MPIEINELVIRAVSDETSSASENVAPQETRSEEDIVKACVKQVLHILKKQKDR